jgi:hypothetical protein
MTRKLSPTKTSADAYRRVTEKVRPAAIGFLNELDDESGEDRVKSLVKLLLLVWDDGYEAAAAMPCEHAAPQHSTTPKEGNAT